MIRRIEGQGPIDHSHFTSVPAGRLIGMADLNATIHARPGRKVTADAEERHVETLGDKALVFLPGLLNYQPGDHYLATLSAPFLKGISLGVSYSDNRIEDHGGFVRVGGNERVLQPDWRGEVSIALDRLAWALDNLQIPKGTGLVFVGHSKGGLLVHAIQALKKIHDEKGEIPGKISSRFPGLSQMPPARLEKVFQAMDGAHFHLLGSPVEGIADGALVRMVDRFFLKGSVRYFSPSFLQSHYEHIGLSPDQASTHMMSRRASGLTSAWSDDQNHDSLFDRFVSRSARTLFQGAALLLGAKDGDGLVSVPRRYTDNLALLAGAYDHVQQVERVDAAKKQLDVIHSHELKLRAAAEKKTIHQEPGRLLRFPHKARVIRGIVAHGTHAYLQGRRGPMNPVSRPH